MKRIIERHETIGNFYAWLERITADFDDGRGSRETFLLGAPDGAFVLPIHKDHIVLVKQNRFTAYGWSFEIPGGIIDDDENPEDAAQRELREETGFVAGKLTPLTESQPHAPFSTLHHLYVGENLEATSRDLDASEQEMQVVLVTLPEILEMIRKKEIRDSKTIIAVLLAKEKGYFT